MSDNTKLDALLIFDLKKQPKAFKMNRFLLLLFIIISITANAQDIAHPYQVVNRFCDCPEMKWTNNSYELKDIHQSTNDIEIRLRSNEGVFLAYRILTKNKGKYSASVYYKMVSDAFYYVPDSMKNGRKWEQSPYVKLNITDKNLDSIFSILINHKIGNLQNQSAISKKYFSASLRIDCKIGDKFTTYSFGTPNTYLIDDKPHEEDYKDYHAIFLALYNLSDGYVEQARDLAGKYSYFPHK